MTTVDQLQASLPAVLRPVLGADVAIENLRVLTGGASRSTWAFDAVTPSGRRSLILRTGAPDDMHAGMEREARCRPPPRRPGLLSHTFLLPRILLRRLAIRF
ncbi:phosphotransferase enzyme family domain protein [Mycobacterium xenopi 4042]|uniref:Phosphotransferase enzyme family domain protein n=1 Tax=Mycobacterium xenopi 4042 TaxID=1299334 RepID=X7Z591_MYCXE|nr:phosphotransferase enzyme family domain protein [Mycobacterium xenopi 4042]